jgi:hypothetical protein
MIHSVVPNKNNKPDINIIRTAEYLLVPSNASWRVKLVT